jgi:hypothetical protein
MQLTRFMRRILVLLMLCWPLQNGVFAQSVMLTPKQQMALHTETLRELMLKLYEQHPNELNKSAQVSARELRDWVFDGKFNWQFEGIRQLQGKEALALVFDDTYQGDKILPLIVGLETLLFKGYGAKNEYQLPTEVDPILLNQTACSVQAFNAQLEEQVNLLGRQENTQPLIQQVLEKIIQIIKKNNALTMQCKSSLNH